MERSATFDFSLLYRAVWWSTAAVIVLGVGREVFIGLYGTETPLGTLRLFWLDEKHSLQAWQQSSLALIGALAALALAASEPAASGLRRYWVALVVVGLYISFDEQVSFHQALVPILNVFHSTSVGSNPRWVYLAAPIAVAIGAFFLPVFWKVPRHLALRFFVSGILFAGAAIGLDYLGSAFPGTSLPYIAEGVVEESLESIGLSLFVVTMLEYWRLHRQDIRISVVKGKQL